MANHRSPKPGLQVRLLPLLFGCPFDTAGVEGSRDVIGGRRCDEQEHRPSSGAADGRPERVPPSRRGERRRRLLPLLW